jgi:uncharacterized protein (DUF1778 family)
MKRARRKLKGSGRQERSVRERSAASRGASATSAASNESGFTITELEAAAAAVVRLFQKWKLSDEKSRRILGNLDRETFARWKSATEYGPFDHELAVRLSLLIGIHKNLRLLFKEPARGYAWIKQPNSALGGLQPVDIMIRGDVASLAEIRAYLERTIVGSSDL